MAESDLTGRAKEVWTRRQAGEDFGAIAESLGISRSSAGQIWRHANNKVHGKKHSPTPLIVREPEKAAAIIDAATDPSLTIQAIAEAEGVPQRTADTLVERFRKRYGGTSGVLAKLKSEAIEERVGAVAVEILDSIDAEDLKKANLYQKVLSSAILIDKRQILNREPTEVISIEDRRMLPELASALMEEIKRRENTVDVTPVSSQPVSEPHS